MGDLKMRNWQRLTRLLLGFVSISGMTASALAQDGALPPDAVRIWQHHNNIGWRQLEQGNYVKAAERFDLAIKEIRPYEKIGRRLLARSYCDLARALYHQERYAEAEPLAKWALTVREEDTKAKPDSVFQCLYVLAMIHKAQKHYSDAEPLLKRAIAIQEENVGLGHLGTATTLDQLALVYCEQGKNGEAALVYRRILTIYEKTNPDENLELADTAERFSALMAKMHRPVEAERWKTRASTIRDNVATKAAKARADASAKKFKTFK
jgi:tetratricopeptide (TPR) repeat protein